LSEDKIFSGKVAIVTGGTRGIGKAIVLELARRGANVAFNFSKSSDEAQALKSEVEGLGVRALAEQCDVANTEAAAEFVGKVKDVFGTVDFLVNNAGITRDQLALRLKDDDWDRVIEVNLTAGFRLARAALRGMMKRRWGRIVGITSVVGATGNPGQSNYAASKAGMIGMTKALAAEVASRGVTVNCVAPGFIETAMTAVLTEEQNQRIAGNVPAGRLGTPAEIAAAVVYLASEEAAYVTGATLHVNGGLAMI